MKKTTTSQRLKEIMKEKGLKQVDILELAKPYCEKYNIKLNKNDLSQYVSGKVEPGQYKLSILGLALHVSEAWLMGYDVPKLPSINFDNSIDSSKPITKESVLDGLEQTKKILSKSVIELEDIAKSNEERIRNEKIHLEKYRALDEHGKRIVDFALEEEYNRCTAIEEEQEEPMIEIRYSLLPASAGTGEFLDDENIEIREFPDTPDARRADIVIPVDGDSMEPVFSDGDELYVRLQPAVEIGEIGIFIVDGKGYVKEYAKDRLISLNPEYDDIYPDEYAEPRCVGKVIGKVE